MFLTTLCIIEELDGPALRALGVQSRKLSNVLKTDLWERCYPYPSYDCIGLVTKIYYLELLRA
jgi:hypothetical protein